MSLSHETAVCGISHYLVKEDGLGHGRGKHEDSDSVTQEGSGTGHEASLLVVVVFRDMGQEGAQENGLGEG
jgi:hypothetical protein